MKRALEFDLAACIGTATEWAPPPPPPVPERCRTPDPMDVLPPEQASLAMLLSAGALGDGSWTAPAPALAAPPPLRVEVLPPARVGPIPPDPHAGLFRDVGGLKKWIAGGCVMGNS